MYIRTTVYQRSTNNSQKHNYICMYNSVQTTSFGHFLTGHHQVGYNVGELFTYLNTVISDSVSTGVEGG